MNCKPVGFFGWCFFCITCFGGQVFATPKILRILTSDCWGGVEEQTLTAYEYFFKKGYAISLMVAKGSSFEKELDKRLIPHCSTDLFNGRARSKEDACQFLYTFCCEHNIDIIHCHKDTEYAIVKVVAKMLNISAIAHYHSHEMPSPLNFKDFDAFISSSPRVAEFMKKANQQHGLGLNQVEFIHPPHNEINLINLHPTLTRNDFFKQQFNIALTDAPVICTVANLFDYKNHTLLFHAIQRLIYQEMVPVQVVLAGVGLLRAKLEKLAIELKIQEYVNFLGFTQQVPEILYYSDIKVLPSKGEAFGIVLMEAALMKKPIIVTSGAHLAGVFIQHNKTGLVCSPNDPEELAQQIKLLIEQPGYAKQLGEAAFVLACEEYSTKRSLDKFEHIYTAVYAQKKGALA